MAQRDDRPLAARVLVYFLLFLAFTGSLAPAVDLGAGEKERGTLETLLASPVDRKAILLGKVGAVMLCGLASAALTIAGQAAASLAVGSTALLAEISVIITFERLLACALLLVLFSGAVSALMLGLSFRARTAREAHQRLSPLLMGVSIIGLAGVSASLPWNVATAAIPGLNASLGLTHFLSAEQTDSLPLLSAALSLAGVFCGGVWWAARALHREETLFRHTP